MKRRRGVLALAGLAFVLMAAAAVVAALLIPEERVAAAAARRAEAMLGTRVRIATAGVDFLPLPGVRLTGVSIGGDDDSTALALVAEVELRARLLPLFRGNVVVRSLELDRPRILLEIDSAGRPNLPLLAGEAADVAPRAGRDIAFEVDGISIDRGRLEFRDHRDGTVVRLDGWTQRLALSGQVQAGEVTQMDLDGWLAFDDIDAHVPDVVLPARDLRLRVEHEATLDRAADRLTLRSLQVALNGITLSGTGTADSLASNTGRSARLELAAEGLDAPELLAWVPDSLRARLALPDGRPLELLGVAALEATVDGPVTADSFPALDGTLVVRDAAVYVDGEPLVDRLEATTVFSRDTVVTRLNGLALGERFQAGAAVRNPASPRVMAAFSGGAELARVNELGLLPDSLAVEGLLVVDLRVQVDLDDPSAAVAVGFANVNELRVDGVQPAVNVPLAAFRFDRDILLFHPIMIRLETERAPIVFEGTLDGWIPVLFDSAAPPPHLGARAEAPSLDLDALLGPSESAYPHLLFARLRDRPIDGRTAAELAEEAGLAVPPLPRIKADITAVIGTLVRNGIGYSDVEAELRLRPESVELESARFGLMGGTVAAAGRLEPVEWDSAGAVTGSRLVARYTLENVGAEPFFNRFTPFQDHLTGELDLVGTVRMALDRHALPDRTTVDADGTLAIAEGRLANWSVLEAATARLGLTAFDTVQFSDWAGSYALTGPLVTLDETVLRGRDLDARAAGAFDLGGRLDLGATLFLSDSLARRAGTVGQQMLAAADDQGRVPVGMTITGTFEAPRIGLDLSEARDAVVERARQAASDEARRAAERAAREVGQEVTERFELPDSLRGLPTDSLRAILGDSLFRMVPDSLKLPADSLAARAEAALKARLKKLWPGGGAAADGGG